MTRDDEIGHREEGLHLHKINQYAMQYLMFSINQLKNNRQRLIEEGQTLNRLGAEEEKVASEQQLKLEALQRKNKAIRQEIEDQKQLVEFEKQNHGETEEMVAGLKEDLKLGRTSLNPADPEVQEFKRVMATARID